MDVLFNDRLLICSDCHSEFTFTAGEQLFFFEKQFKNDPKRCKPCKSRRSGLAAAANGGLPALARPLRTETRTQCSECGLDTTVPFTPTQGRPVLCRRCFQVKSRSTQMISRQQLSAAQQPLPVRTTEETASALTEASTNREGQTLSPAAALLAAVSMASATASSSVSSAADLASIGPAQEGPRASRLLSPRAPERVEPVVVEMLERR